ncbi:MAG: pantoate--beta-alanine ligase [Alphaproteobacteria bacterium]|nr:pantoate--beta-alanine ligase [Alphaproteobacteria bacterium]
MKIYETKQAIREEIARLRKDGSRIGLVPTMGYLHDGHLKLVRLAKEHADHVVVTIFVNPLQFGRNEDLDSYPRDAERDFTLLRQEGVTAVFCPTPEEMYAYGSDTIVDVPRLSGILQGQQRPGHFRGVATVVTKLFNITQPDIAIFGEKDYQQLAVIRRMVTDLDMPIEIIAHPTVREADGLAMSSRNVRLTPEERAIAPIINQALDQAQALARETSDIERLTKCIYTILRKEPRLQIRTVDISDAETLGSITHLTKPAVILITAGLGSVMLLDQRVIAPGKDAV